MHYVRQIIAGEVEEWVHDHFIRYGRGDYLGPVCAVDVKKKIKFKASVEYASVLGWLVCQSDGDLKVNGALFAKRDFRDELRGLGLDYKDKCKPKKGLFVAEVVEEALPAPVLCELYEKVPYATVLLNLTGDKAKLKCKKKPPKPGKEKDVEFCSGALELSVLPQLRQEVFFDAEDFTQAKVENRFIIDELAIPEGLNALEARVHAKRKGKLVRTVTSDGVEKKSEFELLI